MNFLFRGSDGATYVATAGHLLADEEQHIWRDDNGPTAAIDDGTTIGRAVYASDFDAEHDDFALIEVSPGVAASPSVCHWGGPTGINKTRTAEPTVLRLYGAGMGVEEATPERTLIAPRMTNPSLVAAVGVAVPGDSGSPVISDDGRAVGIQYLLGVIWGGRPDTDAFTPGNVGILRLGPQVRRAESVLGIRLRLMTAPRAETRE